MSEGDFVKKRDSPGHYHTDMSYDISPNEIRTGSTDLQNLQVRLSHLTEELNEVRQLLAVNTGFDPECEELLAAAEEIRKEASSCGILAESVDEISRLYQAAEDSAAEKMMQNGI